VARHAVFAAVDEPSRLVEKLGRTGANVHSRLGLAGVVSDSTCCLGDDGIHLCVVAARVNDFSRHRDRIFEVPLP
jgi:hypothetical protein